MEDSTDTTVLFRLHLLRGAVLICMKIGNPILPRPLLFPCQLCFYSVLVFSTYFSNFQIKIQFKSGIAGSTEKLLQEQVNHSCKTTVLVEKKNRFETEATKDDFNKPLNTM